MPTTPTPMVLAADIGGTNSRLAIFTHTAEGLECRLRHTYASQDYANFEAILADFQKRLDQADLSPTAAALAVAGPIDDQGEQRSCQLTNLNWQLESRQIAQQLHLDQVLLLNDFGAIGHALHFLADSQCTRLQAGRMTAQGHRLALGPGTGLGQVQAIRCGDRIEVCPSEGAHANFAPSSGVQIELLETLLKATPRVTWEDLVSGPGLMRLYQFFRSRLSRTTTAQLDTPAKIVEAAQSGQDEVALASVEEFLHLLGSYAGNLALTTLPLGGLYIAGGIAPRLFDRFGTQGFLDAFNDKGPMSHLCQRIPVYLITDTDIGLKGAAHAALATL